MKFATVSGVAVSYSRRAKLPSEVEKTTTADRAGDARAKLRAATKNEAAPMRHKDEAQNINLNINSL
jgi:hypothetical protein